MNGKHVSLAVREWTPGGSFVDEAETQVTLSNASYNVVTTDYTAETTGDRIDVQIYRPGAELISGDHFYADAISLTSSVIPDGNLTSNPSFESGTSGWAQSGNATLDTQADSSAPDRADIATLSLDSGTAAYSMDDDGKTVTEIEPATPYTAFAFVKAGNATTDGKPVSLAIREWDSGGDFVDEGERQVTLSDDEFKPITVSYTPDSSDDQLDIQLYRPSGDIDSGEVVLVDALSLQAGFGSSPDAQPSDTASASTIWPFWGTMDCQNGDRVQWLSSGGDTHPQELSSDPQGNSSYRQLTVFDGDDVSGERCELGLNDHRIGPTAVYNEGDHKITYFSLRLPSSYPLSTDTWQTVMQMKQTQPADGGDGVPILFMGAYDDYWHIESSEKEGGYDTFPATANTWTRFAWDVYYSQDPKKGHLQVSADLNNDGDFADAGESSSTFYGQTLKTEVSGPNGSSDGLSPGDPIPSHLRMGIYHDPTLKCASGCSIDVDNVQIVDAG